jgi:mitochondrial enoyl-[acyl-carrier protein] reductase / trans-2-enoyl-CoA reductase
MPKTLVYDLSAPFPDSLRLITHSTPPTLPPNTQDLVLVRLLAAPINRVDLMVLAGQYPLQPQNAVDGLPVPGFDACGVVTASSSPNFQPDDLVLPRTLGLGTWRTHAVFPAAALMKLPTGTPELAGAVLRSGAVVAWLLLEEAAAATGDWVILSAGTSCVAQFLVQFARMRGLNVILVIRDREGIESVRNRLLELGATAVMTESELARVAAGADGATLPGKVTLALDCVYGSVGQNLVEVLAPGGKFVLVGMLAGAKTSITVETKHLFNRQLSFVSFRGSEVLKKMGDENVEELFEKIARLCADGSVKIPELRLINWDLKDNDELEKVLREAITIAKDDEVGYRKMVWLLS